MKVTSTNDEPLCGRKSVAYEFDNKAATPSRLTLQKDIAKKEKADASLVVVTGIHNTYGTTNFSVTAHVYADKASYDEFVQPALAKKSVIPEEKAPEPAKEEAKVEEAAPAAEEKPAEEAKPAE
jgi:ribosomal protein S24E